MDPMCHVVLIALSLESFNEGGLSKAPETLGAVYDIVSLHHVPFTVSVNTSFSYIPLIAVKLLILATIPVYTLL